MQLQRGETVVKSPQIDVSRSPRCWDRIVVRGGAAAASRRRAQAHAVEPHLTLA
jgi:hypothetical protein